MADSGEFPGPSTVIGLVALSTIQSSHLLLTFWMHVGNQPAYMLAHEHYLCKSRFALSLSVPLILFVLASAVLVEAYEWPRAITFSMLIAQLTWCYVLLPFLYLNTMPDEGDGFEDGEWSLFEFQEDESRAFPEQSPSDFNGQTPVYGTMGTWA